ncbi:MAG: Alpha/beta hydrolase family protein [Planctomycetota bacterium]|nr:Alpha/beta hydrolase family protein [Planctomycetota bacterium]
MTQERRFRTSVLTLILIYLPVDASRADDPPSDIARMFSPPPALHDDLGDYKSLLKFSDGRPVHTESEWRERRGEILKTWHGILGTWPPLIERPKVEKLEALPRDGFTQRKLRLEIAPDRQTDGYFLVPDGPGPFPAVLIVFYEPDTAIGKGKPNLDFGDALVRRGFAVLSIGFDPRVIDTDKSGGKLQPLSYLAYAAANGYNAVAHMPEVDPKRVGVMGHSYGGKWAMFAACLHEKFACGVWSDPGIVFDEPRSNVNYWEPWYLGWEPNRMRKPGLITAENPRTGAYKRLVDTGHDLHELHALMAPRPFLVSGGSEDPPERWKALNHSVAVNALLGQKNRVAMTNREGHTPTKESNEQIYRFLEYVLKPAR